MSITKKIAMITGVGGFIGSHLAIKLLALDYKVYGTDVQNIEELHNLNEAKKHDNFFFSEGTSGIKLSSTTSLLKKQI